MSSFVCSTTSEAYSCVEPWLGAMTSIMMLFIAMVLTRQPWPRPNRHGPHVDGLGVLELTWLLGRDQNGIARRVAELDGRSPGSKSRGYSREGSDGTPSMGSSFSDLDGTWDGLDSVLNVC